MARMLPTTISADVKSGAERKLFARFERELGSEWVVLHSLGLAVHRRKPWAEIDFVLVGPKGVVCLEVKGGRIRREDGQWVFTNRFGHESRKAEGPFEQAGSASAALRNYLVQKDRSLKDITVGYAVATPDVEFSVSGPDVDPELVLDAREAGSPVSGFVGRAFERWTERLGRAGAPLDPSAVNRVVGYLRPDFDARPSLVGIVQNVEGEMLTLTSQQADVFATLVDNERVLVSGGAGTGKTILAVQEAKRLAAEGKRVLLTCFGKRLGQHLRTQVGDGAVAMNFHAVLRQIIGQAENPVTFPDASVDDLMRVFYPEACAEILIAEGPKFDAVVVDEAQDILTDTNLDVLDLLVEGGLSDGTWRVFHDPMQNIFDGTGDSALGRIARYRPAKQRLTINCRNTAPIATATSIITKCDLTSTSTVDGPEIEILTYKDAADQRRHLTKAVNRLRSGGLPLEDIVVLGPRMLANSTLIEGPLTGAAGYELTGLEGSGLRYSTIADFKGLEARAVVLADIDDLDSVGRLPLLYVGSTRPRAWLTLLFSPRAMDQYLLRCQRFGERMAAQITAG